MSSIFLDAGLGFGRGPRYKQDVVGGLVLRTAFALAIVLTVATTAALPLQEIVDHTRGSVVHLSIRNSRGQERSSGSGFVVSADGKLATNFHVVDDAPDAVAVFPGGKEVRIAGGWTFDEANDIAVLQLEPGSYKPLSLADAPARQGDGIAVIGSPLGLGQAVSTGIVSAVRESGIRTRTSADPAWVLQISAATAPGSSGSPILNEHGEVVGIAVGSMRGQALYFGIPVQRLREVLHRAPGTLTPLAEFGNRRSVRSNLLISAGFFGAIALVWWVAAALGRRRNRRSLAQPTPTERSEH